MPPVSVLMKPASGMCNLHCEYCFYCDEVSKRTKQSFGMMSEETLKNVIRRTLLRAEGYAGYAFQGGEPMLRGLDFFEKVVFYQQKYNKNQVRIQNALQTNGTLLNGAWCEFLYKNHFLVGISLDGTEEIHDAYRKGADMADTFGQVLQGIRLLEQYQVDFNILTVVHDLTAEHIEEIYSFYKREGWNYQQYIACLDPLGEPHGNSRYALTPEQYGRFLIRLFSLWYKDWKKGKQPYIRQFDNYIGILMGYAPEACDQRGCCGIQNVVEADGSVYPCDFYMMDDYRLGNFNEDLLDRIDQRRKEIGFLERSRMLEESCKSCKYHFICRGGCQRNRDWDGDVGAYRNYFCRSYRMFFDACMEQLKGVADYARPEKGEIKGGTK